MKKNKGSFDVPRGRNEIIRVKLEKYKGHRGVSIRIWYRAETGELKPTQKGVWIPILLFPNVMKGIKKIRRRAITEGLLPRREKRQEQLCVSN